MTIRERINAIQAEKQNLTARLNEINAMDKYSGNYKAALRQEAIDESLARLKEISRDVDAEVEKLVQKRSKAFDYSNPNLLSAIQLINASGKDLPEIAINSIIEDFKESPTELFFLSDKFEKSGNFVAAIAAKEAAQAASEVESFPDRVADYIYFATHSDPTKDVDFSGINSELEKYENS